MDNKRPWHSPFANLGPPGIARRIVDVPAPTPPAKEKHTRAKAALARAVKAKRKTRPTRKLEADAR